MSRKRVVLAAGLGIAIGYLLKEQLDENKKISPEKALQYAKETFQKNGPINGSWIYIKPEKIDKNGLTYNTYRGGISRNVDGENKQFDFRSEEHTSELQSRGHLVCRLLLEKKNNVNIIYSTI